MKDRREGGLKGRTDGTLDMEGRSPCLCCQSISDTSLEGVNVFQFKDYVH